MFLCGLIYAFSPHYHSHEPFIIPLGVTCSYKPYSISAAVLGRYQMMESNLGYFIHGQSLNRGWYYCKQITWIIIIYIVGNSNGPSRVGKK